ncbi:MAG: hypothetical protein EPN99_13820 [Frankiales bacterium]|nr:MAG: hypothetical protein EPN99_13820 [Frankiales bacterium]
MNIELSPAQAAVVRRVLEQRLSNLSSEIRHTDTPRIREELRDEREALREVVLKLHGVAA